MLLESRSLGEVADFGNHVHVPARMLNRFVQHYEPLSYEPIIVNHSLTRRKRSVGDGDQVVKLIFNAYDR